MIFRSFGMRAVAALVVVVGTVLLVVALVDLMSAPLRAHEAFNALVRANGGSMSHSASYPDTYRSLAAWAIYLRDALLGSAGVVLLGLGTSALLRVEPDRAAMA